MDRDTMQSLGAAFNQVTSQSNNQPKAKVEHYTRDYHQSLNEAYQQIQENPLDTLKRQADRYKRAAQAVYRDLPQAVMQAGADVESGLTGNNASANERERQRRLNDPRLRAVDRAQDIKRQSRDGWWNQTFKGTPLGRPLTDTEKKAIADGLAQRNAAAQTNANAPKPLTSAQQRQQQELDRGYRNARAMANLNPQDVQDFRDRRDRGIKDFGLDALSTGLGIGIGAPAAGLDVGARAATNAIRRAATDPIRVRGLNGQMMDVTPGEGYPATQGGKPGFIVYDEKGNRTFRQNRMADPGRMISDLSDTIRGEPRSRRPQDPPSRGLGSNNGTDAFNNAVGSSSSSSSSSRGSGVDAFNNAVRDQVRAPGTYNNGTNTPSTVATGATPKPPELPAATSGSSGSTPPSQTRTNSDGSTPTRTGTSSTGLTPMQQWAKNFPHLAAKVRQGQKGYEEIQAMRSSSSSSSQPPSVSSNYRSDSSNLGSQARISTPSQTRSLPDATGRNVSQNYQSSAPATALSSQANKIRNNVNSASQGLKSAVSGSDFNEEFLLAVVMMMEEGFTDDFDKAVLLANHCSDELYERLISEGLARVEGNDLHEGVLANLAIGAIGSELLRRPGVRRWIGTQAERGGRWIQRQAPRVRNWIHNVTEPGDSSQDSGSEREVQGTSGSTPTSSTPTQTTTPEPRETTPTRETQTQTQAPTQTRRNPQTTTTQIKRPRANSDGLEGTRLGAALDSYAANPVTAGVHEQANYDLSINKMRSIWGTYLQMQEDEQQRQQQVRKMGAKRTPEQEAEFQAALAPYMKAREQNKKTRENAPGAKGIDWRRGEHHIGDYLRSDGEENIKKKYPKTAPQ